MAKRKAVKKSAAPASRTRGITKQQGEFIHRVHTGKLTKRETAAAAPKPPRAKRAPADVAPKSAQPDGHRNADGGRVYDWTPAYDTSLREAWAANPRTATRVVSVSLGFPFHVVKARIKELRLLDTQSVTQTPRARSRGKRAEASPEVTPSTATPAATSAEATAARLRHAICPNRPTCYTRASWDPNDSIEDLIAQGFSCGFDPDKFAGFPICTNCRTTMVAAEAVEVPEAIRQAAAAAGSHQPRLWLDPPFNADGAIREVFNKRREVRQLKEASEVAQRAAKKAQKAYAKSLVEKDAMEEALEERMIAKQREASRRVEAHEAAAPTPANACVFEGNTGTSCRICHPGLSRALVIAIVASPAAVKASRTAYSDPKSEAHRSYAVAANSRDVDEINTLDTAHVAFALEIAGLLGIDNAVIDTWSEHERATVLAWIEGGSDRAHPPEALGTPHVAAVPGDEGQCCAECGSRLMSFGDDKHARSYPLGALVGSFCTGVEMIPAAAPEQTGASA